MIKVLVADDHPVIRQGIKQILAETADIVVDGEAGTGQEVMERIWANEYDVLLLDISMPDVSGLDVLKQVKNVKPKLVVLILSIYPEEQYATRLLRAGAAGYLTKSSAPDELIAAIRKVALGRKYLSSKLAEKLAADLGKESAGPLYETLSDREYQVMLMIASAKTIKEIATELSLSAKTISTYRSRILDKMGMHRNAEIARYAIENRLL